MKKEAVLRGASLVVQDIINNLHRILDRNQGLFSKPWAVHSRHGLAVGNMTGQHLSYLVAAVEGSSADSVTIY